MIQLKAMGPNLIKIAYLIAPDSPRKAFYTIWIEKCAGGFRVCRESGGGAKVWQRGMWDFESLEKAEGLFDGRVREKTNPERKAKRKYRLVYSHYGGGPATERLCIPPEVAGAPAYRPVMR